MIATEKLLYLPGKALAADTGRQRLTYAGCPRMLADGPDGASVLVVSANGFGKRTSLKQFKVQNRGGKGVTGMKVTAKTGDVVGARMVTPEHTVLLISSGGQIIRRPVSQINLIGRATQGVTLMRPKKGETVVSMTVAEPRLEEPIATAADQNGNEPVA